MSICPLSQCKDAAQRWLLPGRAGYAEVGETCFLAYLQLIEDLRKELEHLQLYKLECERPGRGRSSSSSVSEFNAKTREVEMEHEIKRLKQVSRERPHSLWVSPNELYRTAQKNSYSCMCQYAVLGFLYPHSLPLKMCITFVWNLLVSCNFCT